MRRYHAGFALCPLAAILLSFPACIPIVAGAAAGSAAARKEVAPMYTDEAGAEAFGIWIDSGLAIVEVAPGSPAEAAGLQVGDRIAAIGNPNPGSRGEALLLMARATGRTRFRVIRAGESIVLRAMKPTPPRPKSKDPYPRTD
jgi:S1-C subfamily serine protease